MLVFKPDDSFPRMSSHTYTSAEQLLRQGGNEQKIKIFSLEEHLLGRFLGYFDHIPVHI